MLSLKLCCFAFVSVAICFVSAEGSSGPISTDIQSPLLLALRSKRSPVPDPHRHKIKGAVLVQPVAVPVATVPVYSGGCNVCGGGGGGYHSHKLHGGYGGGYGGYGGYGGGGLVGGFGGSHSSSQASSQSSSFGGFGGSAAQSSAQSASSGFGR